MKRYAAITIMAILMMGTLAATDVRAPVTVNDIVTVVSDYVNGSKVVAGALLNFTGSPPSELTDVTFEWFDPSGALVHSILSDPDDAGFARSNYTVTTLGEWRINASYNQTPDVFYHNVSFEVHEDHWNSSPRVIKRDIIVGEGAVLTIDPGASILFDDVRLSVSGTLVAQGDWNNTIAFSSNSTLPQKGDWNGIYFYTGSDSSVFEHARVEYSGNGTYMQNASPVIGNCTFFNNTYGIRLYASSSLLYNNTLESNTFGLRSFASTPTLVQNTATGNSVGFYSEGSGMFVSRMNIAQGNEQSGFHLDFTTLDSVGDRSEGSIVALRLGSSGGKIEGAVLSGMDDAVYGYSGTATFYNSTFTGGLRDFFLEGGSTLTIVNSTFDGKVSAGTGCPPCHLFVKNYLTIRAVEYQTPNPVDNATVEILDDGLSIFSGQTDSDGYIHNLTLIDVSYVDGTRIDNQTNVIVTHPSLFFAFHNRSVDMNVSKIVLFEGDTTDTDGDGEPDFSDLDDDNDSLSDDVETAIGTDPLDQDTDDDGMPDGWEHQNTLDPTNGSDAAADPDEDGFTNLQEYLNNTDPNNPHSHPPVEDQPEEAEDYLWLYIAIALIVIVIIVISIIFWRRRSG